ncbi:hypothetical protein LL912_15720 [Niabella sp. CC-SYL272]|uniref:hypothetical protein n=1 Tax=Niabella agricola TaxID=2891571 RepID=UPI001F18ACAD|nr:hypothetical protein [Niabella agricola]MCF3110232.1 hypothetical protein [Niabella agricola]
MFQKKMISIFFNLMLLCLGTTGNTGCSREPLARETAAPVEKPKTDTAEPFRIGIYVAPGREYTLDRHYEAIRDAHVNLIQDISMQYTAAEKTAMLVMAARYGIGMVVADARINGTDAAIREMIAEYKNYEATLGYYIKDEPTVSELADAAVRYQKVLSASPGAIAHVNLFPSYATGALGPIQYERDYVEKWIQMAGPKNLGYLSFDNYPFMEKDSLREDHYYHDLDVIRRMGLKYRVKTSAYLQSIGSSVGLRRPNAHELQYSAFTNLAYGIKLPVWFTYWTPGGGTEQFTQAIVDEKGNKTDLYEPFKAINAAMKNLGPCLLRLDAVQVFHTGVHIPAGTVRPSEDFVLQCSDKQASLIVTEFKERDSGNLYIMVVNKSLTETKELAFTLPRGKSVAEVAKTTGKEIKKTLTGGKLADRFEAGEGRLYRIY